MLTGLWREALLNRFVRIGSDEFWMGSPQEHYDIWDKWDENIRPNPDWVNDERNYHQVKLTKTIYVDKFLTTVNDFRIYRDDNQRDESTDAERSLGVAWPNPDVGVWAWGSGSQRLGDNNDWNGAPDAGNQNALYKRQTDPTASLYTVGHPMYGWQMRYKTWDNISWTITYSSRLEGWVEKTICQAFDHPVVGVNHFDVRRYLAWLNRDGGGIKAILEQKYGFRIRFRLLTEAELEYCIRAGSDTIFPWGDDLAGGRNYVNAADEVGACNYDYQWTRRFEFGRNHFNPLEPDDGRSFVFTSPVGAFEPNAFGLYDTLGNVLEMTSDVYLPDYGLGENHTGVVENPRHDPTELERNDRNTLFVCKGGAWCGGPSATRSAHRIRRAAKFRSDYLGFRVCFEAVDN